jgi:hypothetical protein
MEPVSITAMVVSIITAIGVLLSRIKFKHCLCGCIESDCINTPEPSINITEHTPQHTPQSSPNLHRRNISEV